MFQLEETRSTYEYCSTGPLISDTRYQKRDQTPFGLLHHFSLSRNAPYLSNIVPPASTHQTSSAGAAKVPIYLNDFVENCFASLNSPSFVSWIHRSGGQIDTLMHNARDIPWRLAPAAAFSQGYPTHVTIDCGRTILVCIQVSYDTGLLPIRPR